LFVYGSDVVVRGLKEVSIRAGLAVAKSPIPEDPFYFARQVHLLSPKLRLNFIPLLAPKKKSSRQIVAGLLLLTLIAVVIATVVTELKVRARERARQILDGNK
jgi:CHASE1-domain containing sensor protein